MAGLVKDALCCSFKGRIGRLKYFLYQIILAVIPFFLGVVVASIALLFFMMYGGGKAEAHKEMMTDMSPLVMVLFVLLALFIISFFIFMLVAHFSIMTRRAHDFNWLGKAFFFLYEVPATIIWVILAMLFVSLFRDNLAFLSIVDLLYYPIGFVVISFPLLFWKGTTGPNRFGEEPQPMD